MKQYKCKICGGNIECLVQNINLIFYIDENEKIKIKKYSDFESNMSYLMRCSNDPKHNIYLNSESEEEKILDKWCNEYMDEIYDKIKEIE